jgi:hypothetical protein
MKLMVICLLGEVSSIHTKYTSEVFNFDEDNHVAMGIIQAISDKYEGLGLIIKHGGDEQTYVFDCTDTNEQPSEVLTNSFYNELRSELHKAGY